MKRVVMRGIVAVLAVCAVGGSVIAADRYGPDRQVALTGRHWQGNGDITQFRKHDMEIWRQGRWLHTRHEGRKGWWWVVGANWYFYPNPIYPYPDPYRPPLMAGPPPTSVAYWHCEKPSGFYPYVVQCRTPWQAVPARPG